MDSSHGLTRTKWFFVILRATMDNNGYKPHVKELETIVEHVVHEDLNSLAIWMA